MKKAAEMTDRELASYIDYAILKPEMTFSDIAEAVKKGVELGVASVCVNPVYVPMLEDYVKGTDTKISPVADFPFGTSSTASRVAQLNDVLPYETVEEIDIVMNYGMLRSGMTAEVTADLKACVEAVHACNKVLKVILETDALTKEEITAGCQCCMDAEVDFVKTSTGFLTGHELRGAANDVVEQILSLVHDKCRVKGSGCIRTKEHLLELIDLGADRLGVNYTSVLKMFGE